MKKLEKIKINLINALLIGRDKILNIINVKMLKNNDYIRHVNIKCEIIDNLLIYLKNKIYFYFIVIVRFFFIIYLFLTSINIMIFFDFF